MDNHGIWQKDEVMFHNNKVLLLTKGRDKGHYIMIQPNTQHIELGTFNGAIQNIGDATFMASGYLTNFNTILESLLNYCPFSHFANHLLAA